MYLVLSSTKRSNQKNKIRHIFLIELSLLIFFRLLNMFGCKAARPLNIEQQYF